MSLRALAWCGRIPEFHGPGRQARLRSMSRQLLPHRVAVPLQPRVVVRRHGRPIPLRELAAPANQAPVAARARARQFLEQLVVQRHEQVPDGGWRSTRPRIRSGLAHRALPVAGMMQVLQVRSNTADWLDAQFVPDFQPGRAGVPLNGTSRQVQAVFIAQLAAFPGFCLSRRDSQPLTLWEQALADRPHSACIRESSRQSEWENRE